MHIFSGNIEEKKIWKGLEIKVGSVLKNSGNSLLDNQNLTY